MLSNHERRTLREVERDCLAEDPDFVRPFQADEHRPGYRSTATLAMVVAASIGSILLIAGSVVGALAFTVSAGLIWLLRRYSPAVG